MKGSGKKQHRFFFLDPSSLILHRSSFILHPSSFIPHPSSLLEASLPPL
jgi:hypothetical protein